MKPTTRAALIAIAAFATTFGLVCTFPPGKIWECPHGHRDLDSVALIDTYGGGRHPDKASQTRVDRGEAYFADGSGFGAVFPIRPSPPSTVRCAQCGFVARGEVWHKESRTPSGFPRPLSPTLLEFPGPRQSLILWIRYYQRITQGVVLSENLHYVATASLPTVRAQVREWAAACQITLDPVEPPEAKPHRAFPLAPLLAEQLQVWRRGEGRERTTGRVAVTFYPEQGRVHVDLEIECAGRLEAARQRNLPEPFLPTQHSPKFVLPPWFGRYDQTVQNLHLPR
jgi:hypothetical protein